jgi:carboxyl-terminal processing protease
LYKNEIKQELEENIISRFYLQKGVIESSFDDDLDIREAVKVLKDKARYQAILKGVK